MCSCSVAGRFHSQRSKRRPGAITHRTRRESNANRKARIARTIEDTYTHRWEVGGGGGYLRFRSGENLQRNNQVSFWSTGTYFLNPKLGIVGDVRGSYGNAKVGNTIFNIQDPQISQYTFMGGPTLPRLGQREDCHQHLRRRRRGTRQVRQRRQRPLLSRHPRLGVRLPPVLSVGANFDYNLYPNFAIRVTPTYLGTFFRLSPDDTSPGSHGTIQNNLGVNVGLVYRFGRIKNKHRTKTRRNLQRQTFLA